LPERVCVLASGGLDSAVLLGTLARRHVVHPLYVRCGLAIRAPFRRLEKAAVIRRSRDLPLGLTLSCARPRGLRHCGRCTKCAERQHAFAAAGVPDPTRYAQ